MTPAESKLRVEIFLSRKALAVAVVDRICALAAARQSERRPLVLGLAAGASPLEVYRALGRHFLYPSAVVVDLLGYRLSLRINLNDHTPTPICVVYNQQRAPISRVLGFRLESRGTAGNQQLTNFAGDVANPRPCCGSKGNVLVLCRLDGPWARCQRPEYSGPPECRRSAVARPWAR